MFLKELLERKLFCAVSLSLLILFSVISCTGNSASGVKPSLTAGETVSPELMPVIELAPGVTGTLAWGEGFMVFRMTLKPGAEIPKETLDSERIMMLTMGSVEQFANGEWLSMSAHEFERMTPISGRRGKRDFIYLEAGSESAVKAGEFGAEIVEYYAPVRLDYLAKAGVGEIPKSVKATGTPALPSVEPGQVYDYFDVQFTELADGAWSRLISGKYLQLSFMRMDPNSSFDVSNQPEEFLRLVMRGDMQQTALGATNDMAAVALTYFSGGMDHAENTGKFGCDVLDVFSPVNPGYLEKMDTQLAKYHAVIPENEKIELVADGAVSGPGLCYTEGPSWVNGKLYFSSMGYDDRWKAVFERCALVEMDPDGTYRYLNTGMEENGTFPLGNGNLAVCDMHGHRVIEVTLTGDIVRVLADSFNGGQIDGPNDLAVDMKGGIYFSDPQVVPKPHYQPGKLVYYRKPNGEVLCVTKLNEPRKPNGLILSPNNETLYVNSTPDNFMMAFDVKDDGSLSNARKFGIIKLTPEILDRESINPQTDGMTIDEMGNVYVTSILGLQIFSPEGESIGYIHFPLMPVNCCFGDEDGKTLYINCNDKVYKIRTNVRGADYTLKR